VENLPWALDDEGLAEVFAAQGTIVSAECNVNRSGRRAGTASVVYESVEVATAAMETLQGTEVGDPPRQIRIRWDRCV
jgi:RNA recognition motif-containing protein